MRLLSTVDYGPLYMGVIQLQCITLRALLHPGETGVPCLLWCDHSSIKIWMLFDDPWCASNYVHFICDVSSSSWWLLQHPLLLKPYPGKCAMRISILLSGPSSSAQDACQSLWLNGVKRCSKEYLCLGPWKTGLHRLWQVVCTYTQASSDPSQRHIRIKG